MAISLTAKVYLAEAFGGIQKRLLRDIENCGALCAQDAKQSSQNKEYFERLANEFQADIKKLEKAYPNLLALLTTPSQ